MKRRALPAYAERDASEGKRPMLTVTIAPDTYSAIDRLVSHLGISRGRIVDAAILAFLASQAKEHGT